MISIGGYYKGPELSGSKIKRLLQASMKALDVARGPWIDGGDAEPCRGSSLPEVYFEEGSASAVNVVFYVPGPLGSEGPDKIEAARFSRKRKLLLVAVPVPSELVNADQAAAFVIGALRKANQIAAETFARKGDEPFDLEKADAIVEKVRQSLVDQGF